MSEALTSHLHCMHVIEVPPIEDVGGRPDEMAQVYANLQSSAEERLRDTVARVVGEPALDSERVCIETEVGHAARTLVKRAQETDVDWIFLGPHEHRQAFDFGSTTRAVLSHACCGVWVQPGRYRPIRRILVPVDLSEESMQALGAARRAEEVLDPGLGPEGFAHRELNGLAGGQSEKRCCRPGGIIGQAAAGAAKMRLRARAIRS